MSLKVFKSNLVMFILLVPMFVSASATTLYVNNQIGLDSYTGLSPTVGSAFNGPKFTIANAIAAASSGDTISVASTGLAYGDLDANGKTLVFTASGGVLVTQGNVNFTGAAFVGINQIAFTGSTNQTITVPNGGVSISNITINKASGSNKVMIAGGDLTCGGIVTFNNGLIVTDTSNALVLTNGAGASTTKGYTRSLVADGRSHVVGNVKQNLQFSTLIAYARNEFPVGDTVNYRPVALTFLSTSSGNFGIFATVSHTNSRPIGTAGLPITGGIANGIDLNKYAGFYWSIKTDKPMDSTAFNLDLTAAGDATISLTDVGLNKVKIIRRSGTADNIQNQWKLQGVRDSYDAVVSAGVPTIVAVNSTGGLSTSGAIFTYGFGYIICCVPPPVVLTLLGSPYKNILTNSFPPSVGPLTFSAVSSNTTVVTAIVVGDTLILTPVSVGYTNVSVTATDIDYSQISTIFIVTVVCGCSTSVSGTVTYANTSANPIGGVTVTLTPMTGAAFSSTSSATGTYSFANVPPGPFTLTASKSGSWDGVTGSDAQAIAKHAAGITLLTGLSFQAADVNNSGSVTAADAQLLVRRAVGLETSFAVGDWVFSSQTITLGTSNQVVNVTGLAVGDVNASYTSSSGMAFAKSNTPVENEAEEK